MKGKEKERKLTSTHQQSKQGAALARGSVWVQCHAQSTSVVTWQLLNSKLEPFQTQVRVLSHQATTAPKTESSLEQDGGGWYCMLLLVWMSIVCSYVIKLIGNMKLNTFLPRVLVYCWGAVQPYNPSPGSSSLISMSYLDIESLW